jgi:hypothetical protein
VIAALRELMKLRPQRSRARCRRPCRRADKKDDKKADDDDVAGRNEESLVSAAVVWIGASSVAQSAPCRARLASGGGVSRAVAPRARRRRPSVALTTRRSTARG